MSYSVQVEPFRPSHLPPLFQLFRSYFAAGDRLLTSEYSEWLYARNPFGPALMISAEQGGEWAAFLAFIPVRLRRSGDALAGYYAVNALVHPQHQGKMLFARMIKAGRKQIADENTAFLGHPNVQAMATWKRTDVHFQEVLRPFLSFPLSRRNGLRARRIRSPGDLPELSATFAAQAAVRAHWKVDASNRYLAWRYLEHPSSSYKVQLLERGGEPVGVQVARRMRPGLHLMMDQFVPEADLPAATALLPLLTSCFVGENASREMRSALLPLPLKKRMPYFFTTYPQIGAGEARHLALSPSDF